MDPTGSSGAPLYAFNIEELYDYDLPNIRRPSEALTAAAKLGSPTSLARKATTAKLAFLNRARTGARAGRTTLRSSRASRRPREFHDVRVQRRPRLLRREAPSELSLRRGCSSRPFSTCSRRSASSSTIAAKIFPLARNASSSRSGTNSSKALRAPPFARPSNALCYAAHERQDAAADGLTQLSIGKRPACCAHHQPFFRSTAYATTRSALDPSPPLHRHLPRGPASQCQHLFPSRSSTSCGP